MKRLFPIFAVLSLALSGCGGGGGTPVPVIVAGTWIGTMDHDINGTLYHYAIVLVLSQEAAHVTGTMILEYTEHGGHGGSIDGQMQGSHFTGTRTARHVVDITFDVTGDTLVGTFTFVSPDENLNEHGSFVCMRQQAVSQAPAGSP